MGLLSPGGKALIVEDDFLLAMEVESVLRKFGWTEICIAGSVTEAKEQIASGGVSFATLDLKIDKSTCPSVAVALRQNAIPFIYLTGYDRRDIEGFPEAPWLIKPATEQEFETAARLALCCSMS